MNRAENIKRMYEQAELDTLAEKDKNVLKKMKEIYLQESKAEQKTARLSIWRIIMKNYITKLTAAAVIIIIVLGGLKLLPDNSHDIGKWWLSSSVAWGQEILNILDTIQSVTCCERTILVEADGSINESSTWDMLYISQDSYRRDIYDEDFLREIQWYIPDGDGTLHQNIRFDLNSYFINRGEGSFGNYDPIERMRFYVGLLDKADRILGEMVIEERNCIGFEISASKYGDNPEQWIDCIWFDIETRLPVRIEQQGRPVTNQTDKTFTTIHELFNYNPELPSDTFIPWIPEGFINVHPDDIKEVE